MALLDESLALFRQMNDDWSIAYCLTQLGFTAQAEGDHDRALARSGEGLALFRELGDGWGIGLALGCLGLTAHARGDHWPAVVFLEESLQHFRGLGDTSLCARVQGFLGDAVYAVGDRKRARVLYLNSLVAYRDMPDPWGMAVVFHGLSRLAADGGAHRGAALLLGFADRLSNTAVAVSPESGAPTAVKEDISERTQYVNLLRAHLSEAGFSAAWEEGCAMTHEQAISYARDTAPTA